MGARYRTWWQVACGATTVTGAWVAVLSFGLSAVIGVFIFGATTSGLASVVVAQHRTGGTVQGTTLGRIAASYGAVGGVVATATTGLMSSSPALAWLLLLLTATTSPWTLDTVRRRRRNPGPRPVAAADGPPPASVDRQLPPPRAELLADCRLLSDSLLCRRWRASFFELREARTDPERERIVALRADYLAELERRDPSGMSSWLATEPRAASGPEKFLRREAS